MNPIVRSDNHTYVDSTEARHAGPVSDSRGDDIHTSFWFRSNLLIATKDAGISPPKPGFVITPEHDDSDTVDLSEVLVIDDLRTDKFQLSRPLALRKSFDGNEYRIEAPQVELYAFSDSLSDAVDEIIEELIDLCEVVLSAPMANLTLKTYKWKLFLEQYIVDSSHVEHFRLSRD